ncbi:MAG TPA: GNAT family N-acetyltransferase [Acetobacteraceae bacterium]|nr:GNAT family N-acetyltransferase [Acetobacteraceae bacterium]
MIITEATFRDTSDISFLVNRAYRDRQAQGGWTNETGLLRGNRTDPGSLRSVLQEGKRVLLMLRLDAMEPLIGCVSVELIDVATWYISMLAIDPDHQAGGLGRALMKAAEDYARDRGAKTARITVIHLRGALIRWYERRGYRRTGVVQPFPYDDSSVGIPLRDDLRLLVLEKRLDGTEPPRTA